MPASVSPTVAPSGRLARLGVVLDGDAPADRIHRVAKLSDLAGLHVIWVHGDLPVPAGVRTLANSVARAKLGAMVDVSELTDADLLDEIVPVVQALGDRFELTVRSTGEDAPDRLGALGRALRDSLGSTVSLGVELSDDQSVVGLAELFDDFVLRATPTKGSLLDRVGELANALRRSPRPPGGIAVVVPVSVGRTRAEAQARADRGGDYLGLGHPQTAGIFGTLEACQDLMIDLAHAGVSDLRCVPPASFDLDDVVAQLTAVTIGTPDVLRPGLPRSRPPDPPAGWGGRPRFSTSSTEGLGQTGDEAGPAEDR